jgi:hypothetical protein
MKKGKSPRIRDGTCSSGCGRPRRKGQRTCAFCHRQRQRLDRDAKLTDGEILARGIRNCDRMLRRIRK